MKIGTSGLERAARAMNEAAQRMKNPTPVFKLVGLLGVRAVQRNFYAATDPVTGRPWKQLKHRLGGKPLSNHGHMRDGVTFRPTDKGVVIGAGAGTSAFNAIHNFGGLSGMAPGPAAIPQRRFMAISEKEFSSMVKEIKALVRRYLVRGDAS